MITKLNSWSCALSSNKSFGTSDDPSIPIPPHGHLVTPKLAPSYCRQRGDKSFLRPIVKPEFLRPACPFAFHSPGNTPVLSRFLAQSLSSQTRHSSVNFVKTVNSPAIQLCNPLISRVCTLLHVNKKFFQRSPSLINRGRPQEKVSSARSLW